MPITKEEVVQELKDAHALFSDGARKVFALLMKVQNMADAEIVSLRGDITNVLTSGAATQVAASTAAADASATAALRLSPTATVQDAALAARGAAALAAAEAASQSQAYPKASERVVLIPQMNTQANVEAAKANLQAASVLASPEVLAALDNAKSVFKGALERSGLPAHLAGMIDKVSIEDINAHRVAASQAAAITLPTAVVDKPVDDRQAVESSFVGLGSIFSAVLHSDVMFHAKGDLKPGYQVESMPEPLKKYAQDARWVEEASLRQWPTGFYTDRDNKLTQFLVNTDQAAFLVGALPSELSPVDVYIYGSKQGFRAIQSFEVSELRLLHAKLSDTLNAMTKKKG